MPPSTQTHAWGEQHGGRFVTPYYYSQLDLQSHARRTGVSDKEEAEAVQRTTTIVSRVSRRLKLPGKTYAIASNLLHRFYAAWPRKSPYYTEEEMICACMDLACKLQETPIRLPQLSSHVLSEMRGEKLTEEEAKSEMEHRLSPHQQKLLESLQFNTDIVHPFHALAMIAKQLDDVRLGPTVPKSDPPRHWFYKQCSRIVLDTYRITICIQFPAHVIAMASVYVAKDLLDVEVWPILEQDFFGDCGCHGKHVEDAALQILEMYQTNPLTPDHRSIVKVGPALESLRAKIRARPGPGPSSAYPAPPGHYDRDTSDSASPYDQRQ
ncbi:hypothetical protein PhCBS80983_g03097 [Powellomyces hirtus]|uniref:Cyclin N-terminal domain-containing protein n=1 Tax=Powellomyces hirtus TaxID=109895 RepID=A0A507E628_9FUNG|nr:hypothetical protein PhCBS80983_g03097 [Powellomyces hirtus]